MKPRTAPPRPPRPTNGTQEAFALVGLSEPPTDPQADVTIRLRGSLADVSKAMQAVITPKLYVTLAPSDPRMR